MSLRYLEDGWVEIGKRCSTERRSMWMRIKQEKEEIISIELCSGREGDDSYVKIFPDNPAFDGLLGVLTDARFAFET